MSYGTYLYPKLEDFSKLYNLSIEELQASIDGEIRLMTNKFCELRALAFCTPVDTFNKDAYDKIKDKVNMCLNDYMESYAIYFDLSNVLDLKEQSKYVEENKDPFVPYLFFNHYVYRSKEEAQAVLDENIQDLIKLKSRILGICLATPIDITPRDQEQYSDGHEEPVEYIGREMEYLEETLNDCLRSIYIAKITIKYWDGHKEG